jgi:phosphohistidine phosphatase
MTAPLVADPTGQAAWTGVRTLFLLRHAKSSWDDPTLDDHDRPLAPRGRRAAKRIADHFRSEPVRPALVLCSSARRACETLAELKPALGDQAKVLVTDDLYGADADEILNRLREVGQDIASVMIVGHNPGLHDLALELAGEGDEAALSQLHTKFPTGALAILQLSRTGWYELAPGQAYLANLVLPRPLR